MFEIIYKATFLLIDIKIIQYVVMMTYNPTMETDTKPSYKEIQEYIGIETDFVGLAYANAYLSDGNTIIDADLLSVYLKLYQQTPHERIGEVKAEDPSRFVQVSLMSPLEIGSNRPSSPQEDAIVGLWVYDTGRVPCTLIEYLEDFYTELYPQGYAIGLSPMARFGVPGDNGNAEIVFGRCLQLDLEASPDNWDEIMLELGSRLSPEEIDGFVVESSPRGLHFYGHNYEMYNPTGLNRLSSRYGGALLLNREGVRNVDDRSVGHQLRSFRENWHPFIQDSEVGCLRITKSLLKPEHPQFISCLPIYE